MLAISCGGPKPAATDLKVTGAPTGEVTGPTHLTVGFSRPMVTHDQLDQVVAAPPAKISPEIVGEAKWGDEKTLVFWPKADLPVSTRYTVTVAKGTKAIDGNELAEPFSFEFTTPRITATVQIIGNDKRTPRDVPAHIGFSQPVAFEQVVQHCHYAGAAGAINLKLATRKRVPPPESGGGEGGEGEGEAPPPADDQTTEFLVEPVSPLAVDTAWKVVC
ncbi:MAG TPA: Ig-like domain-containing protein [Kofleriaceae bacterium]